MVSRAPLQILALLFAIASWVVVNSGQSVHQKRAIHLQYAQLPKDLVFQRNPLKEVKVDLSGSIYRLRSLSDDDLIYSIDLSLARPGVNRIDLDLENLRLPLDIESNHLNPRSFNIYLEEVFSTSLRLKPAFVGKPKEGFQLGSVRFKPENLLVSGPKSIVSKLSDVEVEVNLNNREMSFSESVKPRVNIPGAEGIDPVMVEVEIVPQLSRLELQSVVAVPSAQGKIRITPSRAKVVIEGASSDLRALESKLQISIPVTGLKRGRYRIRGQIFLPTNVKLVSIEPDNFLIEILQEGVMK
jgi:YbbR domain-containing protein